MTTFADSGVQIRTYKVRAVFEDRTLSLVSAQDCMYQFGVLLYLGYLLSIDLDENAPFVRDSEWFSRMAADAQRQAQTALADTRLERLSYNSPLELVVTISSAAGGVTMVGRSIVSLFDRIQQARVHKAQADAQVEATRLVSQAFREQFNQTQLSQLNLDDYVQEAIEGIFKMSTVEVVDED